MTEALQMDPAYIEAYTNLGQLYRQSSSPKQRRKGEHLWRLAYKLNHNNPRVRENLIDLFSESGRDELVELVQKHEALPPMEDEKARLKEQRQKLREERAKRKASVEDQENSTDEAVVAEGQQVDSENYANEDVIDNTTPEPTEQMMEERLAEQKNESPPELGGMVNSII